MQSHFWTRWHAYSAAGQAALALHSMAMLRCSRPDAHQWRGRSGCSFTQGESFLVSKRLCTLANDLLVLRPICAHWRRRMCWAKLTKEQMFKETTSPQKNGRSTALGSENMRSLWQSASRPIHLRRQLSLPNIFHKEHDALAHEWPSLPLCFPSNLCYCRYSGESGSNGTS